ncbi:transmembrane protein 25 [Brachionichthys hirsutus]|uniref:transmembrane protein 25 n=1 Tax=Brachionichthys hirsutus TaxID=412623 RepID=UPI003604C1F3
MVCVCAAFLFLHMLSLSWTGAINPAPKIDGQRRSAVTLQETMRHQFNCQSDIWDPQAPPLLTWYLNGERQGGPGVRRPGTNHSSSFFLRARRGDSKLVCVASDPQTGSGYNATVTLNVQFQPEILRVDAQYSHTPEPGPGLSLVLFALVRSNPPASISFMDQSGQPVSNASDVLTLDPRGDPWLSNHTLRVVLGSQSGDVSLNASNSVGTAQRNLTLAEFLRSRVEVPVLGIVTGGAMAFMAVLVLSLVVLCLMQKDRGKSRDEPVQLLMTTKSDSAHLRTTGKLRLPRENMSLPSNVQLNDLSTLRKAREAAQQSRAGEKTEEEEEEDLSLAYGARGFARYPMVGFIYRVNSASSEEIWL